MSACIAQLTLSAACFCCAVFGLAVRSSAPGGTTAATLLRTHAPVSARDLPVAKALTYRGAFPVARLELAEEQFASISSGVNVRANLTAFSQFKLHEPNASVAPIVYFALQLESAGAAPTARS